MRKQVEVPESAVELALCSLIEDRMTPPHGEELEVVRQDVREALDAAAPAIYKHFSDRLLSNEALDAGVRAVLTEAAGSPNYWEGLEGEEKDELRKEARKEARLTIEAALQAALTPEG